MTDSEIDVTTHGATAREFLATYGPQPTRNIEQPGQRPRKIRANELIDKIAPAVGCQPHGIRRLILDLRANDAVRVYVELFGDTRLLDLSTMDFDGATVISAKDMPNEP